MSRSNMRLQHGLGSGRECGNMPGSNWEAMCARE